MKKNYLHIECSEGQKDKILDSLGNKIDFLGVNGMLEII